ncbi:hypothetical protein GCM10009733_026290 [Nonomuraea maheshkhaliensis]|uniref:Nuclear transport factor 2 family protein n=1 Tax=Nonomuraea maheshkhaliensis TaxID=419590 RepID=A0ABN2F351_9ACTN
MTDGYMPALVEFDAALADGDIGQVQRAARAYHDTFDVSSGVVAEGAAGRALLDAVTTPGRTLETMNGC